MQENINWYGRLVQLSLFLSLTIGKSFPQSWSSRSSYINIQENARLFGYVISRQRTSGMLSCAHQCLTVRACASFNYEMAASDMSDRHLGMCELNSYEAVTGNKVKPTQEHGWMYGYMKDKNWKQPPDFNFTFKTLGASGAEGPVNTTGYQGTSLEGKVRLENGIQIWTVPTRGTYTIEALGASGANGTNNTGTGVWRTGGSGARMKGTFYFLEGTYLRILVGQVGIRVQHGEPQPGGGGGGSFVTLYDGTPLVIAGGGGGGSCPWIGHHNGDPAQISETGSESGGTGGLGGRLWDIYHKSYDMRFPAGAGGGLLTNGASGVNATGGEAFDNGGKGGVGASGSEGGFGSGGASYCFAGGGGGYSGGGVERATRYSIAGGGGSYNAGTRQEAEVREDKGPGMIIITIEQPDIG